MSTKQCTKCLKELDVTEFYKRVRKSGYESLQSWCKTCQKTGRLRYCKPHEAARKRHGFTDEEYSEIMSKASNGCTSCGQDMGAKVCFDHCHKTGNFRGLLCNNCNTSLGLLHDDPQKILSLYDYRIRHEPQPL